MTENNFDLDILIKEATAIVEDELKIEDKGWINLSSQSGDVISADERILTVKRSRIYYYKDPLGKQAIRLWTDYTFGSGMSNSAEEKTQEALDTYWLAKQNQNILSARGQRKSSDKLLVDGEVFFALFLGAGPEDITIRRIDPLEIIELVANPEDKEDVRFYKRSWYNSAGKAQTEAYYRSHLNIENTPCPDSLGTERKAEEGSAIVYHLAYNTIGLRGTPLLTPALDWIKQYRRFLASRVAIMLALAKFAWRHKLQGNAASVSAIQGVIEGKEVPAGSNLIENMAIDTQPIRTDSNARNAYDDGRMLKLQVAAAVGIPEQYFGDISIGNLATAKTVELPMMKMFQSYQKIWANAYQDMDEIIFTHLGIDEKNWYVDRDFPAIAPEDVAAAASAMAQIISSFPDFADARDVQQQALMTLGINDTAEVLDELEKISAEKKAFKKEQFGNQPPPVAGAVPNPALAIANPEANLVQAIRQYNKYLKEVSRGGNGNSDGKQ